MIDLFYTQCYSRVFFWSWKKKVWIKVRTKYEHRESNNRHQRFSLVIRRIRLCFCLPESERSCAAPDWQRGQRFSCRCCSRRAAFHCATSWHEPPVHEGSRTPEWEGVWFTLLKKKHLKNNNKKSGFQILILSIEGKSTRTLFGHNFNWISYFFLSCFIFLIKK